MSHMVQRSPLRLFVSCQQLVNLDLLSLTDATVELFEQDWDRSTWNSIFRTGVIWNDLNPNFVESFEFDFFIEDHKKFLLRVYDVDQEHQSLGSANFIGSAEYLVSEIVTQPGMKMTKPLMHSTYKEKRGLITIRLEEVFDKNEVIRLSLSGVQLPDPRSCFASFFTFRTFYRLSRAMETGDFQAVFTSEIKPGSDPLWGNIKLTMSRLCNSDYHRPVLIEVFCESPCGMMNHILIGRVEVSISKLLDLGQAVLYLEGSASHNGSIVVKHISVVKEPTFIEYISNGCELGLIAAVDFTASNGDPRYTESLHHVSQQSSYNYFIGNKAVPEPSNQYEQALKAVADVLIEYDSDKRVPMFGFGAVTHQFGLSHCFPMNGNIHDPEVDGVDGMIKTYRSALMGLQLSGPTYFSEIIRAAIAQAEEAARNPGKLKYYVLLILTDGIITDLQQTIDCIVYASKLPMSIVIVGIGDADFTNMVRLDADTTPLVSSSGQKMERDIVQFVPFNSVKQSLKMIRKEVLAELPSDLVNYFVSKGQMPRIDLSKLF
mmetsp:Transcript_32790/g.57076  ORF Transcript_32790/g.57076 Transcript_32790/m.57076 type:complete len:545 (-) Transcript_32790:27-1661(-)